MRSLVIAAFAAATTLASGQATAPLPLITNGSVTVTSDDFEAFLLRAPEQNWPEIRANLELIGKAVDSVYENRVLAAEARRLGYDKDPRIALRMKQVEEGFLAQVWANRQRKAYEPPNLEARAQDIYKLNKEKYTDPARVFGNFVAISMQGRTREDAQKVAAEVARRARSGTPFAELVKEYAKDDPSFRRHEGKMQGVTRKDLEPAVAEIVFSTKPGNVTDPIQARGGFVVIKVDSRTEERLRPFSEVREQIVAEETERLRNEMIERKVADLKLTPDTVVHGKNMEALKVELDPVALEKLHKKAADDARKRIESENAAVLR